MCGIVGYVGKKDCVSLIYEGLRRLEYRGYDSAGIAVMKNGKIDIVKSQGKLKELEPFLQNLPKESTVGMGHTRWATHGSPVTRNAHPHTTEKSAIVHNGIIENYRELKAELIAGGVVFQSETDTEVVLHLLEKERSTAKNGLEAIVRSIPKLRGAFSLGVMFASEPNVVYVVKQGSPLVVGLGDGETVFGSDATALVDLSKSAVFLNDGECGRISATGLELWDFEGKPLRFRPTQLNWSSANIEKRGFKHFMLKEIYEQPNVVANTLERLYDRNSGAFRDTELGIDKVDFQRIKAVQIVACGSAYFAGFAAKYFAEPRLGVPVHVELASEFRYREPYLDPDTLLIAVSQSGETADTLASVKHARSMGCQIMSVCNVRYSSIPRESQAVLYMEAGPEIGVCSTKCFVSQILCLNLLTLAMSQRMPKKRNVSVQKEIDECMTLPAMLDRVINSAESIEHLAAEYYESSNFLFIGRGLNYAIALEGALKLKEISYVHAEAYAAGELKHGPIALVDRHMPIVGIAPKDKYYEKTISNIEEVHAREGVMIGVGGDQDTNLQGLSRSYLSVPQSQSEVCQAILNVVPLQLMAYYIAVKRGTDVDQPRNLAKSVTVE